MKKKCVSFVYLSVLTVLFSSPLLAGEEGTDEKYTVNNKKSSVKWTAKSVKGGHFGSIGISSGSILHDGKTITGGSVTIDMNSITVQDLEDPGRRDRLTAHLKNDDFFATDKFPEARLVITGSKPGTGGKLDITGDLTIKGITNPITVPATLKTQGSNIEAEGTMSVDRILYGIKFRSKSMLDPSALADKLIYDEFTLDFKVVAGK